MLQVEQEGGTSNVPPNFNSVTELEKEWEVDAEEKEGKEGKAGAPGGTLAGGEGGG